MGGSLDDLEARGRQALLIGGMSRESPSPEGPLQNAPEKG